MSPLKSIPLLLLLSSFLLTPSFSMEFLSFSASYDPVKAKFLWYYECASYCSPSNIVTWNVSTVAQIFPHVQQITVFTNSTGENQAYTAYDADNDLVILAVRGSANIDNWFENLDAFMTVYDKCDGCEVHAGFLGAYLDLRDSIVPSLIDLYYNHPGAKIAVLGHSLGAAIATFAFVDIYQQIQRVDYFFTFGSPRVGNPNFATFVNSLNTEAFKARITHNEDPVPHLPLDSMGFLHIDREVFYVEDNSEFTICAENQEDPMCANQFHIISESISDHMEYMGFSQSLFKLKCL